MCRQYKILFGNPKFFPTPMVSDYAVSTVVVKNKYFD